jgi:hypothetical protein
MPSEHAGEITTDTALAAASKIDLVPILAADVRSVCATGLAVYHGGLRSKVDMMLGKAQGVMTEFSSLAI